MRRREEEQEFGERHCRQAGWDHPDLKTMDSEMRPIPPKRLIELTREREREAHTPFGLQVVRTVADTRCSGPLFKVLYPIRRSQLTTNHMGRGVLDLYLSKGPDRGRGSLSLRFVTFVHTGQIECVRDSDWSYDGPESSMNRGMAFLHCEAFECRGADWRSSPDHAIRVFSLFHATMGASAGSLKRLWSLAFS